MYSSWFILKKLQLSTLCLTIEKPTGIATKGYGTYMCNIAEWDLATMIRAGRQGTLFVKTNHYPSPFPLFFSFGGGGNLGHFRYEFTMLEANRIVLWPKNYIFFILLNFIFFSSSSSSKKVLGPSMSIVALWKTMYMCEGRVFVQVKNRIKTSLWA